jgi:ribosomal protein S18 acetylase RimI-like enzyme
MDAYTDRSPARRAVDDVRVRRAHRPSDWHAARRLLDEYLDWLEGHEYLARTDTAYKNQADRLRPAVTFGRPHRLFLASLGHGGDHVGCVGVRLSGAKAELTRLYVSPEARGFGAARALVLAAVADTTARGFDRLYLDTHPPTMPAAYHLYREAGFVVTGAQAGVPDGVSMELALPAAKRRL